jgi:hypothetical protein
MAKAEWKKRKTLLIVGEGYHDVAFLNHVKQFPGVCGHGVQISIKNARGKGALGVIDHAIKLSANIDYDQVAVLLDTDTDWSPAAQKLANDHKIQVLPSDPCIEALLLRAIGKIPGAAKDLKKQFAPFVNNDPLQAKNYADHFGLATLQGARTGEKTIDQLLKLLGI